MANNFLPYPAGLPTAEVSYLLGYLRGQPRDLPLTAHAAWSVAGYALSQTIPDAPVPAMAPGAEPPTLAEYLERLDDKPDEGAARGLFDAFDWKALARLLLSEVLSKVLS